ncbi:MAG: nucleotidyltransferase domain-containing protein [Melioribacter sp.]|uniref:nucleotidyltransferase domain-containing protein n=1 Tax=Melioribacter sp. TaxID=2052167 RepID=UPI003BEC3978
MNNYVELSGVAAGDWEAIVDKIIKNKKVKKIILFGSRAKGNYKKGSDIDIAIIADRLSYEELNQIRVDVSELMLPFKIDIIDFNKINNSELREHIQRVGKVLFG